MRKVQFKDLGNMDYKECWDYQEQVFGDIIKMKMANRDSENPETPPNYLFFVEHPHVYTLGKSGDEQHLLATPESLREQQATFYKINRGGDITYHGPGQIVGYPIFDLDQFFTDIHKYLRFLEEGIIITLAEYGISAGRIEGLTGVWLDIEKPLQARKIAALGVKCSRWVTMHGFAFNVNTDLNYFNNIVPCGIDDKAVTTMEKELGHAMDMEEVKNKLLVNLANLFDFDLVK
ncbi:MAG: lipoyl(octanoyl) transferase LipB [Flavobacteriales bacterium]|nr:lipoyl(octanoyl) transferase LipB [Flavobacteriales bacterium]